MTPQYTDDFDEFGDILAKTPPPAADSRACHWSCRHGHVSEPEERKPASVWDILRWFWRGR